MYLEKLVVQGFKSFANKNTLVFPGMINKDKRGLTAIVGPNGSGKSNIADAVRWALGEQSMKTLRGKKSQDIIFSGSDKKGKLGMAEVSLYLNNEGNSGKKAPIDYSEVVLTRRLFRDGESEYLLNQSKARLSDIQMLLAKANFGQKTYSVVGQGMVEGFLNTTLAERKEFFDEATGVKQFQIKRDDSLNKLSSSYDNLSQVEMLLGEIEPRLKSLTRQVNKLEKRENLEKELKELQLKYYSQSWHEINNKFNKYNKEFLSLEKEKIDKEKKLARLNDELEKLEKVSRISNEFETWQEDLDKLRENKDEYTKQLARLDAQIEIKFDSKGQFDLSWLNSKREELNKSIDKIKEEVEGLNKNIDSEKNIFSDLAGQQEKFDSRLAELRRSLAGLESDKQGAVKPVEINQNLQELLSELSGLEAENDLSKIKSILQDFKARFKKIISKFSGYENQAKIEEIKNEILRLVNDKGGLLLKINESNLRISARSERVKLLEEQKNNISAELKVIEDKMGKNQQEFNLDEIEKGRKNLKDKLLGLEEKIKDIKNKIDDYGGQEEKARARLFSLQKDAQALQNEINNLNIKLSELKINSTRYETRLEDLEIDIRSDLNSLKEVRETKPAENFNSEESLVRIKRLQSQLELIGGIDPETAKEYKETKERFDFLTNQVDDLAKGIESLEKIIRELDITIKEKFDKEFEIISKKFEEYFKILFNGGIAKIVKVIEDDITENQIEGKEGEINSGQEVVEEKTNFDAKRIRFLKKHNATGLAGIEIQATPPGKKIKSVSMLSGGERALTAIALICAIISANPSPFVVLDEVDAALDEANSERLAKILDDLSHKTQFIVITHNRASMRRANILYGVTMGDDGASKLLSIKLENS